jgi:DNA-binding beta-propeller fold protein YncE
VKISAPFKHLVMDPVRPYAYVNNGGTEVRVYHIYTGQIAGSFTLGGSWLGPMAIDADGSKLYLLDAANFLVLPVSLPDGTAGSGWPTGAPYPVEPAFARPNGKPLLVLTSGEVFDARTGSDLGRTGMAGGSLAVNLDGSRLAMQSTGTSPEGFSVATLDFTAADGGKLVMGPLGYGSAGSDGQDLALNHDGSRLYVACGAPYAFPVFDTASGIQVTSLPGNPYPNNVEVAKDGRIFAGAMDYYDPVDIWSYDPATGALLASFRAAHGTILAGQLKVSGDGFRLGVLTDDPTLTFITVLPH